MRSLVLLFVVALMAVGAPPGAAQPEKGLVPTFSKSFAPGTIGPGSVSTLTFTIDNPDPSTPLDQLAFTDTLPAGVTIATPANGLSQCGGTLSAPSGGTTITFSGGMLGVSSSCTITVDVTSATVGAHMNVSGTLTSNIGSHGTASATLTVATDRPGFTKSFSPSNVVFGARSTLTFTIDNTANAAPATALSFTDALPPGMTIATPSNAATDCGTAPGVPTLTAVPGTATISLNYLGSVLLPGVAAGGTCTVSVDVIGGAVGMLGNTSGDLSATVSGMSRSCGMAAAVLTVTGGATEPILLTKEFTDDPVAPGGTVTLRFTITNTSRTDSATAIAFSDDLSLAVPGLTFTSVVSNTCSVAPTGIGTSTISFSGGSLAPEATCTFDVALAVPAGAMPGTPTNTTSTITATVGGMGVSGSAASDPLFIVAFPVLTKSFTDDPVGGGGTVTLEFTITNTSTASAAGSIAFTDELTTFLPSPVSVGLPPSPNPPCGAGSSLALIGCGTDCQTLSLTGGSLAAAGAMGDSCTFSLTVDIPDGFPGGSHTNTTGAISAELTDLMGPPTVIGPGASDDLVVLAAPTLTKSFTDDPVAPGGTVTLELTLTHDAFAPADAMAVAFTDDLTTVLAGLTASAVASNTCTGATVDISTPTLIDVSGGSLTPGGTCTITVTLSVPGTATPGLFNNTTSDVTATVSGVATTGDPATDDLRIAGLMLTKEFTDDPAIPGGTVNLRFTLDNTTGTADATAILFFDVLSAVLPGLTAVLPPTPAPPCGVGSSVVGTTLLIFTGGTVTMGTSCTFDVTLSVPMAAPSGSFPNITSSLTATIGGTPLVLQPATDVLVVDPELLAIGKAFTDDPAVPGGTVTLDLTIDNIHPTLAASAIAFSDDLGAALAGLTIGSVLSDSCGGTPAGVGTGMLTYTGGSLASGASCVLSLSLDVPAGPLPGDTFTNTTSSVTGMIAGLPVSGPAASDDLRVVAQLLQKSFGGVGFPGGTVTLTFTLTNLDASAGVSGLSFSDSLPAGLSAVPPLPSAPCGAGSTLSGTTFLTLSGASLGPGGMCSFPITVQVPAGAAPGSFLNTTSDLFSFGLSASGPATDPLVIEPPPLFSKSFAPDPIVAGAVSTLTFTIDNTAAAVAASALDFTDNLPAGVVVASPANAATTCVAGTLTAVPGTGTISYSGGTVNAGTTCTVSVDVTSAVVAAYVNTTGDLTSSSGNSGPASDTLTVTATPLPLFSLSFAPNPVAAGSISVMTFTIDNTASLVAASGLDFTNTLPAGVQIATPANATTDCTGGTLSAVAGATVISYTAGTVAAAAACIVQVDVVAPAPGSYANTSGDLTSSAGNSGPASDTLLVLAAQLDIPTLGEWGLLALAALLALLGISRLRPH